MTSTPPRRKMRVGRSLRAWRGSTEKDNPLQYQNAELQQQYELHEMPKRTSDALKWLEDPVRRLLQFRPIQTQFRLLSPGCGPGSDLLASIESLLNQGIAPNAVLSCTGVDLAHWKRTSYYQTVMVLKLRQWLRSDFADCPTIETDFRQENMQGFINSSVQLLRMQAILGGTAEAAQYDLITLSYANAKETLQGGIAKLLPLILRPGGSIVIIDNNTAQLRKLMQENPDYKTVYRNSYKLVLVLQN